MRRGTNIVTCCCLVVLTALVSCGHDHDKEQSRIPADTATTVSVLKDSVVKNGNVTTTFSTDLEKLGTLLNFKTYRPTKVKFKYTFIDNSGQNERLSVPGPSDNSLEAVLYFDSLTFEIFLDNKLRGDYPSPNYKKDEFKFVWLDEQILTELENSSKSYHGEPDFFFGITNGKCWYLDKKILIKKLTN